MPGESVTKRSRSQAGHNSARFRHSGRARDACNGGGGGDSAPPAGEDETDVRAGKKGEKAVEAGREADLLSLRTHATLEANHVFS